jgi:hypothetical protein
MPLQDWFLLAILYLWICDYVFAAMDAAPFSDAEDF